MKKTLKRRIRHSRKRGGLRFGRITKLAGGTKKLRFSDDMKSNKVYEYYLEEGEIDSKKTPPEEKNNLLFLNECFVKIYKDPVTNKYDFMYMNDSRYYPCKHKNLVFDTPDELNEFISRKINKLNSTGKKTADLYKEFRQHNKLAPSKTNRMLAEKAERDNMHREDKPHNVTPNKRNREIIRDNAEY